MKQRLSKTGCTQFSIENIDYMTLNMALESYRQIVESKKEEDFENSIVSQQYLLDSVDRLTKAFEVDMSTPKPPKSPPPPPPQDDGVAGDNGSFV